MVSRRQAVFTLGIKRNSELRKIWFMVTIFSDDILVIILCPSLCAALLCSIEQGTAKICFGSRHTRFTRFKVRCAFEWSWADYLTSLSLNFLIFKHGNNSTVGVMFKWNINDNNVVSHIISLVYIGNQYVCWIIITTIVSDSFAP